MLCRLVISLAFGVEAERAAMMAARSLPPMSGPNGSDLGCWKAGRALQTLAAGRQPAGGSRESSCAAAADRRFKVRSGMPTTAGRTLPLATSASTSASSSAALRCCSLVVRPASMSPRLVTYRSPHQVVGVGHEVKHLQAAPPGPMRGAALPARLHLLLHLQEVEVAQQAHPCRSRLAPAGKGRFERLVEAEAACLPELWHCCCQRRRVGGQCGCRQCWRSCPLQGLHVIVREVGDAACAQGELQHQPRAGLAALQVYPQPRCTRSTTSTGCCRPLGLMRLLWGMSATSRDVSLKARCRAPGRSHSTNQA
ncbi:hypothetical protein C2E20_3450 isoform A [Micractinium conductrix]|nr:hypothetical protein C2E20_3450 isoform A [Micractinium conductrix]|eukprot:PSC73325.1 hypothetical protein C2E20_3450 isoform A [Micractinium conductrix]